MGPTVLLYLGGQVSGGTHLLDTQAPSLLQPRSSWGGASQSSPWGATQQGVLSRSRADSGLKRNPLAAPLSPAPRPHPINLQELADPCLRGIGVRRSNTTGFLKLGQGCGESPVPLTA